MRMASVLLTIISISIFSNIGQSAFGKSSFILSYGGSYVDKAYDVKQTNDKGFIVLGSTTSFGFGSYDILILKFDESGKFQLGKDLGYSYFDIGSCVLQTADSGYIVGGITDNFGTSDDILLIKLNYKGELEWTKTIGGEKGEYISSIRKTIDGGFILIGDTKSYGAGDTDFFLIKLDNSFNIEWSKAIGGKSKDYTESGRQTLDEGFIITGSTYTYGAGSMDTLLIKCNKLGDIEWAKTIGGTSEDHVFSVIQTFNGDFIVSTIYCDNMCKVLLTKFDNSGKFQWSKQTDGFGTPYYKSGFELTSDGGFVLAGYYGEDPGDIYFIKYDNLANIEFSKRIGGEGMDYGNAVQQLDDGGYIIAGSTTDEVLQKQVLLIKTDINGEIEGCDYVKSELSTAISVTPTIITVNPLSESPTLTFQEQSIRKYSLSAEATSLLCSLQSDDVKEDFGLEDVIISLQICSGKSEIEHFKDTNDDNKINFEDIIFMLKSISSKILTK